MAYVMKIENPCPGYQKPGGCKRLATYRVFSHKNTPLVDLCLRCARKLEAVLDRDEALTDATPDS